MALKTALTCGLIAGSVLLAGCQAIGSAKDAFANLAAVQRAVGERAGPYPITVNVHNDRYLTISVVNSPLHDLPAETKQAKALELAKVAYQAYASRDRLQRVQVVFAVHRTYFLFFHVNNATDVHAFGAGVLGAEVMQLLRPASVPQGPGT